MKKQNVQNKIYDWFAKKKFKVDNDSNLLKDKILDSFDIIDFITFLENSFSIKFHNNELQDINLFKLKKLIKLIEKKINDLL